MSRAVAGRESPARRSGASRLRLTMEQPRSGGI